MKGGPIGNAFRLLLTFWALLAGSAFAADWSLEVMSIEVDGRQVASTMLQVTVPQRAEAQDRIVERGERFAVGSVIAAPARTTLLLRSGNANSLRLLPGSRIRVLAGGESGEEFGQEAGQSLFDVKRALNFFNVRHGRFQAIVKGTVFSVKVVPGVEIAFDVEEGGLRIEREGKLKIDEGDTEGTITVSETLKAGESKSFRLDIDEYLARFEHFGEAEAFYRRNLEADRLSGDPDRIEIGLTQLGIVLIALSRYREAIPLFEECRQSTLGRHPGGVDANIAASLKNLGVAYRDLGGTENVQRAIALFESSLEIERELYPGGVHATIAAGLNNLGAVYRDLGGTNNLERAIAFHEDSLKIRRQLYPGGIHADIAASLVNLGVAHRDLGGTDHRQRAIEYFDGSLKIQRQLYPGGVHADIAASLNNLGVVYYDLGGTQNLERAIAFHEDSLRIRRQLYPSGVHADVAASLDNLGSAYHGLGGSGNIQRAIGYHEDSLEILGRLYPCGGQANIAASLVNLGTAYAALGGTNNLERAIEYFEKGLEVQRRLYPGGAHPDIASTLGNLGSAYVDLGGAENLERATRYLENGLAVQRRLDPGGGNVDVARSLASLSYVHLLVGRTSEALRDAKVAVLIAPGEVWIRTNEAHALLLAGRQDEALAIYARYRDWPVNARQTFSAAVLDDFAAFRKAGIDHPGMAVVEALYGQPAGAAPRR